MHMELEAAAFRRLVEHLRERSDVQNIDLMELAGFCRNCLANWYQEAAASKGLSLSKEEAREIIYGMPYETEGEVPKKSCQAAQALWLGRLNLEENEGPRLSKCLV